MGRLLKENKLKFVLKQITNLKSFLFKDKLNFKFQERAVWSHIDGHFLWKDKNNKIKKGWSVYGKDLCVVLPLEKSSIKNGCIYLAKKNTKNI